MSHIFQKPKSNKVKVNAASLGRSELIRKVQSLTTKELPKNQTRFSEKLTKNMDFNGSLKLSELSGQLRVLEKQYLSQKATDQSLSVKDNSTQPSLQKAESVTAAFNRVQRSLLMNIQQSFDPSVEQARFPLPLLKSGEAEDAKDGDYSGYQRFYLAQQSEMSAKIQGLRKYIRETLFTLSANMAKLAFIDKTLEETIGLPLRSGLSAVVAVIKQHTQKLESKPFQNDTLHELHIDLQQLLLAELELRLQPLQGLLDALNHEVKEVHE